MTRSSMPLSVRWRNVKAKRRRCVSDVIQDVAYLLTGYFV